MTDFSELLSQALRHRGEDPVSLLFTKTKLGDVHPKLVAQQLQGFELAKLKWPSLALNDHIVYPPHINCEQSSSEVAANYKADSIVGVANSLADLTGGMAVDTMAFAHCVKTVDYVELNEELVTIVKHNLQVLGVTNITVHSDDSSHWLSTAHNHYDWLYLDPARRDTMGRRVVSLADCFPNVVELLPTLKKLSDKILIKASPMVDITETCLMLHCVSDVHIVSVNHECKEALFVVDCNRQTVDLDETELTCVDIFGSTLWKNNYRLSDERHAHALFADRIGGYLYEPNPSLMKAGAYNSLSLWYGVQKLARNTHLYTSDQLVDDFPGRIFQVESQVPLNRKALAPLLHEAKVNVVVRNFPATAASLRSQLALSEGGEKFLFATTLGCHKTGILCQRIATN